MVTQSVSELVSQLIIQSEDRNYFLIKKKNRKNPQTLLQVSDFRYNVFIVYLRILDSLQDLPGKSRHAHCLTVCEKLVRIMELSQELGENVTSSYHGSKISGA